MRFLSNDFSALHDCYGASNGSFSAVGAAHDEKRRFVTEYYYDEPKPVTARPRANRALDDAEICERLRLGDQQALRLIMERHASAVLRLALNILSDAGEAEDVVQEVFISVWKNREAWVGGNAKFSTWLHRVTINKAIDKRRVRRSRPEPMEYITSISDAACAAEAPCDQTRRVDQLETAKKLGAEIDRLPEAQARALRYFYFESRDVRAIAELMDSTEQAVRSLLKRGRQALRQRLMTQEKTFSNDAFAVRSPDQHVRTGRRSLAG